MNNIRLLIDELKLHHCTIRLNDTGNINLILEDGAGLPDELIAKVRENKPALVAYLKAALQTAGPAIEREPAAESYPISDAQRRLWMLSQFEGASIAYNVPGHMYLDENLDITCFKRAVDAVIERHEILRTVFKENEAGEVRQWVLKKDDFGFSMGYKDLRRTKKKEDKIKAFLEEDSSQAFDLEKGPLLRAGLLRIETDRCLFWFNMHHIISDGWSIEVLSKDVFQYYEAYKEKRDPAIKPLRIQYKDYSVWQLKQLETQSFKSHREYWLNQLKGELPLLELPVTKMRPKIKTHQGYGLHTYIGAAVTGRLKAYAEKQGGSLFMALLSAWNVLMYRYTAQKDIITGTPVSGREHADLEEQIGFYVNTLALRNEIRPEESFDAFFLRLRENTLNAFSHQMYPFDRLVEDLNSQRDLSRSAVFDVMLVLQNTEKNTEKQELGPKALSEVEHLGYRTSKLDMGIIFRETGNYLSLLLEFNPDVYEIEIVESLVRHYRQLLEVIVENTAVPISQLDYLGTEEKQALTAISGDTDVVYPAEKTIVDLFEDRVALYPRSTALVFADKSLSYKDLNENSNQLAHYLTTVYKIKRGDIVGLKLERSETLIIAILAILKAGAAYLPIDTASPDEKINYIRTDSKLVLIIDPAVLSEFEAQRSAYPRTNLQVPVTPEDLIYIIYTSGSTGQPKGVAVEHRSLVAHIHTVKELYGVSARSRFLQFFNIAFDAAAQEIFTSLCFGASIYLKTENVDPDYIYDLIAKHKITHADFSTAFFNSFISVFDPARYDHKLQFCAIGGEKLEKASVQKQLPNILGFTKNFYNVYGPTETTLTATWFAIVKNGRCQSIGDIIPIGRPYAGRQVVILDEYMNVVPRGVRGEICIGGVQVARGYLNKPELSSSKFIPNPFKEGERLYRTGDSGRWLLDGNIEFSGRTDNQVKIRGYRIEPGEVEHALLGKAAVKEAVVLAGSQANGEKYLVAYFTAAAPQNNAALRDYLKEHLPEYMIPAYFVQLEALPLTSNGKVDRKALPDPEGLGLSSGVDYVAPQTEAQKVLVGVWSDVLKREGIGIKDSFFNLGGDSIKSIQVVSRLKQKGYTLKVEHILRTPVLEELALLMQRSSRVSEQSVVEGRVELTPVQHWFFEEPLIREPSYFNQSVLLKSKETLDRELLEKSITALVRHHDVLRMIYRKNNDGSWEQRNRGVEANHYRLDFYDLADSSEPAKDINSLGENLQSGLDLEKGPLFRVVHFRLKDGDRLGLILHHLLVDGVSWRILLEDLSMLYSGYRSGQTAVLPLKTDSFQKWAKLQKEYAGSYSAEKERSYWEKLSDQDILPLPQEKESSASATVDSSISFHLDKVSTELLQTRVHGAYNTEINDILLTGLGLALQEVFDRDRAVIRMEGHGREEILEDVDISRTVGWFTSMYPFVLDVSGSASQRAALVQVKESLRKLPGKGIGYGILKYLSQEGLKDSLKAEILFNYLGDFGSNVGSAKSDTAIFDYASESLGATSSLRNGNPVLLDISGMLVFGELSLSLRYSRDKYPTERIRTLAIAYEKHLKALIAELSEEKQKRLTPSDLSFKGLSISELSELNADGNLEDVYELSPLQEGIYYHWLAESSGRVYFDQTSYRVRSKGLDMDKLRRAYEHLIARHGILRTGFSSDYAGRSLQIVRKEVTGSFTSEKIGAGRSKAEKREYTRQVKEKDRERGFDLSGPSQMRLHVIDLLKGEYEFIWSFHHILMDGWCMSVLIHDFNQFLSVEITQRTAELPAVVPYANYINWINKLDKESSLVYWRACLMGYSQVAKVPFKKSPEWQGYTGSAERFQIEGDLLKKTDALCNRAGITRNTFIQGVWGYLLSRYNSTNDVVFGAVVSGRPAELEGVEDMTGLFINTIPVRARYEFTDTALDLLKSLQDQSIQSTPHHYLNLSEVQALSEPGKNLIDHILVFENYAIKEMTTDGILSGGQAFAVENVEVFEQNNYDLTIAVSPSTHTVTIEVRYNENRYDDVLLKRLIKHFEKLVGDFVEYPERALSDFNYLLQEEERELLQTFNNTAVDYPREKTVVELFYEQVTKTPHTTALVFEGKTLSYEELDKLSNQLAHYLLQNYQIRVEDLVGIQLERSEWMMVAILGILKAGGAYVPIDAGFPQERIDYIKKDTACKVCLDNEALKKFKETRESYSGARVHAGIKAQNLIYVIYTSGSTGIPKGVLLEHGGVVNRLLWMRRDLEVSAADVFLQKTPVTFDVSVWELFLPLISGNKLVIAKPGGHKDPAYLGQIITEQQVSIIHFVPSMLSGMLEDIAWDTFKKLRHVVCSGEALTKKLEILFKERAAHVQLNNYYGPTEASVDVTAINLSARPTLRDEVSIGRPVDNTSIYILDEKNRLQAVGVQGEILIGGVQVARGYLNKPELSSSKFIPNPFKEGERLYRTGDSGRWLLDGNIEFSGRTDNQVKIRGYRIEPGEVEHALLGKAAVKEAVVLAGSQANGEKYLVAYFTAAAPQNNAALRDYLKEHLPEYMIPAYFVQLEALPLTSNGKVDRKALPDPEGLGLSSGVDYVAPQTEAQKVLVGVWSDVLKREGIGIKDSFFNLGGDSIKSIQVVSRLKQKGYTIKVEHILRTPVLEELALLMQRSSRVSEQSVVEGRVELTPVQHWFFEEPLIREPSYFNQSVLLKSKETLDRELLEKSITALVRHHDVLRMIYRKNNDGSWEQRNRGVEANHYRLDFYDLADSSEPAKDINSLGENLQSGLDLEKGPLFRVVHFRLKDGDRLGLILHHLLVDGVSWRILLEDLSTLYSGYRSGQTAVLPLKTDSFQKWAKLQKEYSGSYSAEKERSYWEKLSDQDILPLPQEKESSASATVDSSISFQLDKVSTELLQTRVHGAYNTEINDILLTGLGLALQEVFDRDRAVIRMEGHGREEILEDVDISRTVGWFTSMYPFVLDVSNSATQRAALVQVKESLRKLPGKGIGYGILKYLSQEGLKDSLKAEILFNYLGDFGSNAGDKNDIVFDYASESLGAGSSLLNENNAYLDISAILIQGELSLSLRYPKDRYHAETIRTLAVAYEKHLKALIAELSEEKQKRLTPSDLSFKGLSISELGELNADGNLEDVYELSPLQEGIYYHWLANRSGTAYFDQTSYRVRSKELDMEKLRRAYEALTTRHGILRTGFSSDYAGRSLQIVRKEVTGNFTYERVPGKINQEARQDFVDQVKQADHIRGFDLGGPSQMRLHVIDLLKGEYEFIWSFHHILMDGWCMSVLIHDFNQLWTAELKGQTLELPAVVPYSNYIRWLNRLNKESSQVYWRARLMGYSQVAEVPFKIQNRESRYHEQKKQLVIEGEWFKKANAFCSSSEITQNTLIQGVWGYLLSCYNNTNDVVFGSVVSGRPAELEGVEEMIGLFVNTIPVRVRYEFTDTALDLLKSLQDQSIQSTPHHYLNLSEVQALSEPGKNLIDHIVVFDNYAVKEPLNNGVLNNPEEDGIYIEPAGVLEENSYDLNIVILPSEAALSIEIRYNANRYNGSLMTRLSEHFDNLLRKFIACAEQPLHTLTYLAEEERTQLKLFNATQTEYPSDKTFLDMFATQAEKAPGSPALKSRARTLSYKALDELSNQLADCLIRDYGVKPQDLVGIKLDKEEWAVLSMLAVLKAGAAYVPVDPDYPQSRKQHILAESQLSVLITSTNYLYDDEEFEGRVFAVDVEFDPSHYSKAPLNRVEDTSSLAYVIYTSGSTGEAKGVMIEHRSLTNYLYWAWTHYSGGDKKALHFGLFSSLSFDLTITSLFLPLVSGGSLSLFEQSGDISSVLNSYFNSEINCIKLTPAHIGLLKSLDIKHTGIEVAIVGGDKLEVSHAESLRALNATMRIYNEYGPTESTVGCTVSEVLPGSEVITIGGPVFNTEICILNEAQQLQAPGVTGELCIGGDGLARGYLNQEALTKEKFIAHPFKKGARLYKTGDLGKWLPDGSIDFQGRKDDQVKIRGYRIELGEVESVLSRHEGVESCAVVVQENEVGEKELVAYVVPDRETAFTVKQVLDSHTGKLDYEAELYEMENGVSLYAYNKSEVNMLYTEVFEHRTYDRNGISIPPDACIVDIGANVGSFSVYALINFENARVYSFEPLPPIYELLKHNAALYKGRMEVFNVGISDREEEAEFDYYPYATVLSGRHSENYGIRDAVRKFISNSQDNNGADVSESEMEELLNNRLETKKYKCKLKTLSQVIAENGIRYIDFLKVDAENAEMEILAGIRAEDWEKIGQMVLEVFDVDGRLEKVKSLLSARGFEVEVNQSDELDGTHFYDVYAIGKQQAKEKPAVRTSRTQGWYGTNALEEDIRRKLREGLPDYMIPSDIILMPQLPLTANGKIDRKNLLEQDRRKRSTRISNVAPQTEAQKVLVGVWSDVLKREGIGIKDSFFNLGGDSIKSIQVVSRLKQKGYTLKVEHILRTPVLEELALLMQRSSRVSEQSVVEGRVELTPVQHWFFEEPLIREPSYFNQSVLLKSKETLDRELLEKSITALVRHHDVLRMIYRKNNDGSWEQRNRGVEANHYRLDFYDLADSSEPAKDINSLGENLQSGLDLEKGPLFRVVHFRLKDGDRLGLILHHLLVDGVSWRILLEDLSMLYSGYRSGQTAVLPLKTDSFQKWAKLQKEYSGSYSAEKERSYWEKLSDQDILPLPQDKESSASATVDSSISFHLDKVSTELLQTRVHGAYNTEINDILLTGLGLALQEVFDRDRAVIRMEGHGREEILEDVDISRTVGWFTSMYPFVLDVSNSATQRAALVQVKESLRKLPGKGIGYGILKYLSQEGLKDSLKAEILFNYLGDFGSNVGSAKSDTAIFDYASESLGATSSLRNGNPVLLDISGMLVFGELSLSLRYSRDKYPTERIRTLAIAYEKHLKALIKELSETASKNLTPSDLSFKGLSISELSELNADGNLEDVYELSPLQEGIYYHWLTEDSGMFYFEQMSYRVKASDLEIEKLRRAYAGIVSRHGILRTGFSNRYAGRSLQIVRKAVTDQFSYEKLSGKDAQAYINKVKQSDRERGFDLSGDSQMRLHVIELVAGEYEFIWSHHHILMDGWCMSVLIDDFNQLLSAELKGTAAHLPAVVPYSAYIRWLNRLDKASSLAYWKEELSGYKEVAVVPFRNYPEETGYTSGSERLWIEGDLFKKLTSLCSRTGITQNTFIQGVWGYLLSRYNSTTDVVFGSVVSGRPAELEGVEEMIGLFVNTIPVRVRYAPDNTPAELLSHLQDQSIRSTSHHYVNLSEVQSQSEPGMNLINHILIFENYVVKEQSGESAFNTGEKKSSVELDELFERTNYDFNITASPYDTALRVDIKYNAARYDSQDIKRVTDHIRNLIREFAEYSDRALSSLNYISAYEEQELLVTFNTTAVNYPQDKTLVDLFHEQVGKSADSVALVFREKEMSYRALDEISSQLAHYLQKNYSIGADDLVGIKQGRSEWLLISILAILKAGGAYVPVDPEYPEERIHYIEKDTKCRVVIDEKELDAFRETCGQYSKIHYTPAISPGNLAYVIYTSGSTGKPKGVMIEHRNVINFFTGMTSILGGQPGTFLSMTNFTFDISVLELLWTLCQGYKVVLQHNAREMDGEDNYSVYARIREHKVTHLQITPSMAGMFNQYLTSDTAWNSLEKILLGGERLTTQLVKSLYEKLPDVQLYNMYGPTETTIWSTSQAIAKQAEEISIGRPIANTGIYILDGYRRLVPVGIQGEIYIGGEGVARGYTNKALTEMSFVENPYRPGERLYRTGDFAAWRNDGTLNYIGRKDDQVKVRGYRIELKEIEQALQEQEQIKEAVVITKENEQGEKDLVAYFTATSAQHANSLRASLKALLPEYMLPAYYIQLDELPLNSSGKINKQALPPPDGLGIASGTEYMAPRNETEEKLVKIWEELLQRDGIGIYDDFFALGGHSLKATQLMIRIEKSLDVKLDFRNFLSRPTIEGLSGSITTLKWMKDKNEDATIEQDEIII